MSKETGGPFDFDAFGEGATEQPVLNYAELEQDRKQKAIIEACAGDRLFYAEVVLGITFEPWQKKVIEALDAGDKRIAIRSGNGAGKTMLLAVIISHYILFRNDVKIPVTAPSSSQLKDGLIPETNLWIKKLPAFLRDKLHITEDRITRKDNPANNFVSFRTARKESPEALAGIHAKFVMCVVDEASAVDDAVYEAAQGTMSTPGSIFIMISNPTRLTGYFHKVFHRLKHRWRLFHVTSFDTSRVDYDFVQTIAETYGEESNQYRVKVLGEFPDSEEDSLISRADILAACERDIGPENMLHKAYDVIWGVDCGRGGDLSAIAVRKGIWMGDIATKNYTDTMQTAGWVLQKWLDTPDDMKPRYIYVDSIGIGAGVADRLRETIQSDLTSVVDVNVSESATIKIKHQRMRDEIGYRMKDWFESKRVKFDLTTLVKDKQDDIIAEMSTPLALFTSSGKDAVESKKEMKARGFNSPNVFDACGMTFAFEGAGIAGSLGAANKSSNWNKPLDYTASAGVW